jgi:acyl carrier protein
MHTEEEVMQKLAEALQVNRDLLTPETRAVDLPTWDSMGMVNIVFMLEQDFGLTLEINQAPNLQSVSDLLSLLRTAGKIR